MKNAIGDTGEAIGDLLAPAVISIAKFLTNAAESSTEFFKRMTETSLETTIRELRDLGVEIEYLTKLEASSTLLINL